MLDFDSNQDLLESQMAYKIVNCLTRKYPYPHGQIDNFLPNELLDKLLENWPDSDEFISNAQSGSILRSDGKDVVKKETAYDFRNQIALTEKEEIERIKGKKLEVWRFFTKLLTSSKLISAFIRLYASPLMSRFNLKSPGDLFEKVKYSPRIHLIHDKTNYALGPHTDNQGKVIVILVYFESDVLSDDKNHFGTAVYIPREEGFKCETGQHHSHDKFLKVFSADFQKNNAFSFCRSDVSFHGVEKVQEKSVERKLLQYSLYGSLK